MYKFTALAIVTMMAAVGVGSARQPSTGGPYKILKTAKVGGEGGWDYIYADAAGRRLYIPRGAVREAAATDTTPAVAALPPRIIAYDLDTLEKVGEIPDTGGNGVAVCPNTGHGFSSSRPAITMFDTKEERMQEFPLPTRHTHPYDVIWDKNGELWTGGMTTDRVVRLDPKTGESVEYQLPRNTNMRRMFVDNTTARPTFWVGSNHGASIVRVEPQD